MIFILATWPVLGLSCLLLGLQLLRFAGTEHFRDERVGLRADHILLGAVWSGLAVQGALFTLAALFFPVSLLLSIILVLVPFALLAQKKMRAQTAHYLKEAFCVGQPWTVSSLAYAFVIAVVAYIASDQFTLFDTAFYHLPLARILNEFGALPGLVLLHTNFGQSSSWFALAAAGTAGGEFGWGASTLNGFVAGVAALHFSLAVRFAGRGGVCAADCVAALGYPIVLILSARWGMISSLSPDFAIMLLSVVVVWALSLTVNTGAASRFGIVVALVCAAFALGIKISSAPLLIVTGLAALVGLFTPFSHLVRLVVIAAVLVIPAWLLSVMSSGCLVYPVVATCFELPWTPDADKIRWYMDLIMSAAQSGGKEVQVQLTFAERILRWGERDTSGFLVVSTGLLSLLILSALAVASYVRPQYSLRFPYLAFFAVGFGILYVSATAPTARFIGGYTAAAIGLLVWCVWIKRYHATREISGTLFVLFVIMGLLLSHNSGPAAEARRLVAEGVRSGVYPDPGSGVLRPKRILPYDIEDPSRMQMPEARHRASGFSDILVADRMGECWAASPPCTPQLPSPDLRYRKAERGSAGGFERRKAQ
ncbi:MAG: hypothetical protein VXY20_13050 [Pseudomonadota bacterium]|nr:hypothetical protein [Pseudomonadota bacterium]